MVHQLVIIIIIIMIRFVACTYPPLLGAQGANPETPGQAPSLSSVLGSFTCITQHTGPTALCAIRRTNQLWFSVLLKDTNAATGQAGIQTHILATPELESNARDRLGHNTPKRYEKGSKSRRVNANLSLSIRGYHARCNSIQYLSLCVACQKQQDPHMDLVVW